MFKKLILVSAILAVTTGAALANPAPYVGGSIGIASNSGKNVSGHARNVPVSAFAGYGGLVNQNIYLGGEVFGTLAAKKFNGNALQTRYGFGASVIPGVMISDHTLAFARAGVVRTRFKGANKGRNGAQIGLGLQTSLTQNVDIRGEYDYTRYRAINNYKPQTNAFTVGLVYKFD